MDFEWDEDKSTLNLARRGFEGPVIEWPDDRRDYGEDRIIALGCVDGEWLVVVYTWRGEARRIISARLASRKERPS